MTVRLLGRLAPGTAGETRREVHLFAVAQDDPDNPVSLCGQRFRAEDLEWLAAFGGMPCERCMARAQRERAPLQRGRPVIEASTTIGCARLPLERRIPQSVPAPAVLGPDLSPGMRAELAKRVLVGLRRLDRPGEGIPAPRRPAR
ncbi:MULTISPECIES: hypothetical protein [Actinomycetes]|uniref:Uncharacterized protein n=2 Tax=Actinomycetes TaxID=1760 RepID=A0A5N8X8E0_9ACTN|nr:MULTISPECIES: hypothetical protein [Actinomycetes]MPY55466.1 hypothetical protein [Streptomyces acidicola]GHF30896.1 hypothetical protein GCM10017786_76010 [Amycolatopsis deserti]